MLHGKYGEFMFLVDHQVVIDGGWFAFLGRLPGGAGLPDVSPSSVAR
jgi:hypothetical protein